MNSVAFVTYNQIGNGLADGWHDRNGRRALVLQNTRGEGALNGGRPIGAERRREELELLWGKIQGVKQELDHVVVYVGVRGSERAIEFAAQLPAEKVTIVSCDCSVPAKVRMLMAAGLDLRRVVVCECGGHRTMEKLFENFMETGELVLAAA